MVKAMYPGSFDPITIGHVDIIKRAATTFDEVVVAVMSNPKKQATFNVEERIAMIVKCVESFENVKVIAGTGLTVELAESLECSVLIRGIRAIADYEYELQQATTNMILKQNIETVFFVARPEYSFLSSSMAKEIASLHGDITKFIPSEIKKEVIQRLAK